MRYMVRLEVNAFCILRRSARVNSECTFPPQEWDPVSGKMVTVRQRNKRKKPPATPGSSTSGPSTSQSHFQHAYTAPHQGVLPGSTPSTAGMTGEVSFAQTPFTLDRAMSTTADMPPIDPALMSGDDVTDGIFSLFGSQFDGHLTPWPFPDLSQPAEPSQVPNVLFDLGLTMSLPHSPQQYEGSLDSNRDPLATLLGVDTQ